jgi:hypothetical protein
LELSIRENASLADLDEISPFWIVDRKRERNPVDRSRWSRMASCRRSS